MKAEYIDLSHKIDNDLITYKGLPAPLICDYYSREESRKNYSDGSEFQIARIDMVVNTGTYIDCPFHRYEDGEDFSEIQLKRLADLEAIVIRCDHSLGIEIDMDIMDGLDINGKAVLFNTNWDAYWKTDTYFENHPFLTKRLAQYLRDSEVALVGIDSHNIDDTRFGERPVHTILLNSGILIVEHLCNLKQVPNSGFQFTAVPPKIKGVGSFPVRAFAKLIKT